MVHLSTALGARRGAREIAEAADRIAALIVTVTKTRPSRGATKAVVTGFSQGSFLSFALAVRHPEVVRAAFPISGALPPSLVPTVGVAPGSHPPIVAFHGTADAMVPIDPTRALVARLTVLGFQIVFVEEPGVGHTVPAQTEHDVLARIAHALIVDW